MRQFKFTGMQQCQPLTPFHLLTELLYFYHRALYLYSSYSSSSSPRSTTHTQSHRRALSSAQSTPCARTAQPNNTLYTPCVQTSIRCGNGRFCRSATLAVWCRSDAKCTCRYMSIRRRLAWTYGSGRHPVEASSDVRKLFINFPSSTSPSLVCSWWSQFRKSSGV